MVKIRVEAEEEVVEGSKFVAVVIGDNGDDYSLFVEGLSYRQVIAIATTLKATAEAALEEKEGLEIIKKDVNH